MSLVVDWEPEHISRGITGNARFYVKCVRLGGGGGGGGGGGEINEVNISTQAPFYLLIISLKFSTEQQTILSGTFY